MSGRLVDIAREAGLSPAELREHLAAEIDRVIRDRVGETRASDPPRARRAPTPSRRRQVDAVTTCPNGHPYGEDDFDSRGRRRCSRCKAKR